MQEVPEGGRVEDKSEHDTGQGVLGSGGEILEGAGASSLEPLSLDKKFGLYSKCRRKPVGRFLKEKRLGGAMAMEIHGCI